MLLENGKASLVPRLFVYRRSNSWKGGKDSLATHKEEAYLAATLQSWLASYLFPGWTAGEWELQLEAVTTEITRKNYFNVFAELVKTPHSLPDHPHTLASFQTTLTP